MTYILVIYKDNRLVVNGNYTDYDTITMVF